MSGEKENNMATVKKEVTHTETHLTCDLCARGVHAAWETIKPCLGCGKDTCESCVAFRITIGREYRDKRFWICNNCGPKVLVKNVKNFIQTYKTIVSGE